MKKSRKTDKRKKAFTLVELLIVIAIIAILAAMLMPALSRTRQQTRKIACISNLKQCGLALNSYMNDFDGYSMPAMLTEYGYDVSTNIWAKVLITFEYIPGRLGSNNTIIGNTAFSCPSLATDNQNSEAMQIYGMIGTYNSSTTPHVRFINISKMGDPSRNIWFADSAYQNRQIGYFDGGFNYPNPLAWSALRIIQVRHGGTANSWFIDGHAASSNPKKLREYANHEFYYYLENSDVALTEP